MCMYATHTHTNIHNRIFIIQPKEVGNPFPFVTTSPRTGLEGMTLSEISQRKASPA